MTATLQDAMREIQEEMISRIPNPARCEAPGCRAYGPDASPAATYCEAHSPGPCLYEGCDTHTRPRDAYGLCPEHAAPAAQARASWEVRQELSKTYGAETFRARRKPRREAPISITREELVAAQGMLYSLTEEEHSILQGNRILYPTGPEWRSGNRKDLRYMAPIARAVARGNYYLQESA